MSGRSRGFCYTYNNYDDTIQQSLQSIVCVYHTYGRETAPTTGTKHLQGYIYFANGRRITAVRNLLGRAHVEVAVTVDAAITYCQKEGDFYEAGERPVNAAEKGVKEQQRWLDAWEKAKSGLIEEIPADIRMRQYSAIKRIQKDYMCKPSLLPSVCGIWIYGRSGTGKTHTVYESYPDLYSKNASKNWDGYQGEDVVLLDDVDPGQKDWISRFLKIWADKYPFVADNKGSSVNIRPGKFIITSQYRINEIFHDEPTIEALTRRYRFIEKHSLEEKINIS